MLVAAGAGSARGCYTGTTAPFFENIARPIFACAEENVPPKVRIAMVETIGGLTGVNYCKFDRGSSYASSPGTEELRSLVPVSSI